MKSWFQKLFKNWSPWPTLNFFCFLWSAKLRLCLLTMALSSKLSIYEVLIKWNTNSPCQRVNGGSSLKLHINTSAVILMYSQDRCPGLVSLSNGKAFSKPLRCKEYYSFGCCQNTVLLEFWKKIYISSKAILIFWGHVPKP